MLLNQYLKGKFHKKGFTLIELLIVVAIIAILVGIGATRYQAVIQRGRDAQRKSDLRSVATALEQYYGDRSSYPTEVSGSITCGSVPDTLDWNTTEDFECDFDPPNPTTIYQGDLPSDPLFDPSDPSIHEQYYYQGNKVDDTSCGATETDCQRYILAAVLENTSDPEIPQPSGICFTSPGGTEYNFCVRNP